MPVVRSVPHKNVARFSVCVVPSQGAADLLVYKADNRNEAQWSEAVWSFAEDGPGATTVHFTEAQSLADLRIHYVPEKTLCGWMRRHRLKGRLVR